MAKQAIEGERKTIFNVALDRLVMVTDPQHELYDERVKLPINERWARRMAVHGCRSIIKARRDGESLMIVDGRQRYKTAVRASEIRAEQGLPPLTIKVELEKGTLVELSLLAEELNTYRFNDDPVSRARKALRQVNLGVPEVEVAEAFDWSVEALRFNLKLLDLDPKVQAAVAAGDVGLTEAVRGFGKLSAEDQRKKLAETAPLDKRPDGKPKRRKKLAGRPRKTFVAKVVDQPGLSPAVREAIGWVMGMVPEGEVSGALAAAIKKAGEKPVKKKHAK